MAPFLLILGFFLVVPNMYLADPVLVLEEHEEYEDDDQDEDNEYEDYDEYYEAEYEYEDYEDYDGDNEDYERSAGTEADTVLTTDTSIEIKASEGATNQGATTRARLEIKSCQFVDLTRVGELCTTGQKIKYYKVGPRRLLS